MEVEAESVAHLACAAAGLVTDACSPYVARWANGDLDLVRSTAARVVACAREVLEAIGAGGTEDAEGPALLATTGA